MKRTPSDGTVISTANPDADTSKTATLICEECHRAAVKGMPAGGPLPDFCCCVPGVWGYCANTPPQGKVWAYVTDRAKRPPL